MYLRPLNPIRFELKERHTATVQRNGHVRLDRHYYSVPHRLIGRKVNILYDSRTVEIYCGGDRVAVHPRGWRPYGYTTEPNHLASFTTDLSGWSVEGFLRQGGTHTCRRRGLPAACHRVKDPSRTGLQILQGHTVVRIQGRQRPPGQACQGSHPPDSTTTAPSTRYCAAVMTASMTTPFPVKSARRAPRCPGMQTYAGRNTSGNISIQQYIQQWK